MPGPESPVPQPDSTTNYDSLFNPDVEMDGSVEDAAVRPASDKAGTADLTDAHEADRDAALRVRTPRPPLTDEQAGRLEGMRGQPLTAEDRRGIDQSRAHGTWKAPWGE